MPTKSRKRTVSTEPYRLPPLPRSAPLPPEAEPPGAVEWTLGDDGTQYVDHGRHQVVVERGPSARVSGARLFTVCLRMLDPQSMTNICYVYATDLPINAAKSVAGSVALDPRGMPVLTAYVERGNRPWDAKEDGKYFGWFGRYVVPVTARSKLELVPYRRRGKRRKKRP